MTLPLRWKHRHQPSQGAIAAGRRFLWPIAFRAFVWAVLVEGLALGILYLIAPTIPVPLAPLAIASVGLPALFLLAPVAALFPSSVSFRLDEKRLLADRKPVFRWRNAIGFAVRHEPDEALPLVGAGGRPARIPLPTEPVRAALLQTLQRRLALLPPDREQAYAASIVFAWSEVLAFTGLAFCYALIAGLLASTLVPIVSSPIFFLCMLALSVPPSVIAVIHVSRRYPQFPWLRLPVGIFTGMFTSGLAMPFSAAFTVRALGWT